MAGAADVSGDEHDDDDNNNRNRLKGADRNIWPGKIILHFTHIAFVCTIVDTVLVSNPQ
jgi:hypothetical protein